MVDPLHLPAAERKALRRALKAADRRGDSEEVLRLLAKHPSVKRSQETQAEATTMHLALGLRTPAVLDCHLADQQLLAAMRYLIGTGPMNEQTWTVLRQAARRGDLFIVTREAGDSEHRYARMQKGRRGR